MEFPGGLVVRPLQGAQVPIPGWGIKILQLQDVAKNQKATRQPDMHHWIKMAHGLLLLFKRLNVCFSPVCSFSPPQYWKWTLHPQHRCYLFPFLISLGLEFTEFSTHSHLWL